MPTVLITGANRGIGLEFARQYAADGWRVIGTAREPAKAKELRSTPGDITVRALDVTEFSAIAALATALAGTAIDVLINNAGVFGPKAQADKDPRQSFGHMDYDVAATVIRTNTFAPLRMAEAFCEHVARSGQKKIAAVSSTIGSIAEAGGGNYAYRVSKAALNMVMKAMAVDLGPKGIATATFCPGWVQTSMGGPGATIDAATSVKGLRERIGEMTLANSGQYRRYNGEAIPW